MKYWFLTLWAVLNELFTTPNAIATPFFCERIGLATRADVEGVLGF